MKYYWIRFYSGIPEYGQYGEDELDDLVVWFTSGMEDDYDYMQKQERIKEILLDMPTGMVNIINGHRIVKVLTNEQF